MKKMSFDMAINEALKEEMRRDDRVVVFGQDVGVAGGVRGVTRGLYDEFGKERVRDTPISEAVIVGAGVGAAVTGLVPVVEVMYSDFMLAAGDEVMNKMTKWRYMHGGIMEVPMVMRSSCGGGFGGAAEHSQSLESTLMHFPGIYIAYPSNPEDAKGLLKSAIREKNPVAFFEHRLLYKTKGMVPEDEYLIPFGKAAIKKAGKDLTIVAAGYMVLLAIQAAEELADEGIDVEVIDLRTLAPLDYETVFESVSKTGRLVVVEEGHKTLGFGAEIVARVVEQGYALNKVERVASKDVPIPYSPVMEKFVIPNVHAIKEAVKRCIV